jgi:hypothetical protein
VGLNSNFPGKQACCCSVVLICVFVCFLGDARAGSRLGHRTEEFSAAFRPKSSSCLFCFGTKCHRKSTGDRVPGDPERHLGCCISELPNFRVNQGRMRLETMISRCFGSKLAYFVLLALLRESAENRTQIDDPCSCHELRDIHCARKFAWQVAKWRPMRFSALSACNDLVGNGVEWGQVAGALADYFNGNMDSATSKLVREVNRWTIWHTFLGSNIRDSTQWL